MLSDVILPEMSGPELADLFTEFTRRRSACSWQAQEVCERILRRNRPFLPKPFVPATLVNKVREVLSASTGDSLVLA